jgi:hypothetical protein
MPVFSDGWTQALAGRELMYRIEAKTVVERRADEVWAFIADLNNQKLWDPDVLDIQWHSPVGLGDTFVITVDLGGGRPLVGDARIASYEPGRQIGWEARPRAAGWITGGGRSLLVATYLTQSLAGDRTTLTRRLEIEGHGLLRVLGPGLAFLARRERFAEITNLKRILEARPIASSPSIGQQTGSADRVRGDGDRKAG